MIREYRTVEEIASPLMIVRMVDGVTYDELCRAAIEKGAPTAKLFAIPAREKIGRAKSVEVDEYPKVYEEISREMEAEIQAIAEQGGEDQ